MGGRGAKSSGRREIIVGTGGGVQYGRKRYPLKKLGKEVADGVLKRLQSIARDFPDIPTLKELNTGYLGRDVAGESNSVTGEITLGLSKGARYGSQELEEVYDENVKAGFHPKGTTWKNVFDHEVGHKIIDAIHVKQGGSLLFGRYNTAERIVSEAYKRLNTSKSLFETRKDISIYALDNMHETVAEAFADYRANGKRAKPLSVAIYSVLKEEMSK